MSSKNEQTIEKLRVNISGMSCSFCTMTIQKAVGRMEGVEAVHISLAHEEALIEYDPVQRSAERDPRHAAPVGLHRTRR